MQTNLSPNRNPSSNPSFNSMTEPDFVICCVYKTLFLLWFYSVYVEVIV